MDSEQEKLKSLLQRLGNHEAVSLTPEEMHRLEEFKRRYPFFTLPDLSTGSGVSVDNAPSLQDAVTAPSCEALARMRDDLQATRFDGFYPEVNKTQTPTTSDAIEDFLNTYGKQSQEEDQLLEKLIFNPIPDYAQQLAHEEEMNLPLEPMTDTKNSTPADTPSATSAEDRLNRFILTHRRGQPQLTSLSDEETAAGKETEKINRRKVASKPESEKPIPGKNATNAPSDGLLSESLAKIYIKTRRYEQAYEILNGLSLRFPEKSGYFADQLRFLRKLILNEQRRRLENQTENNPN